jgi:hypothetical protein
MGRAISEFQILVYRQDGELSVYLVTPAWGAGEATEQAERLVTNAMPRAEVWADGSLINTIELEAAAASRRPS